MKKIAKKISITSFILFLLITIVFGVIEYNDKGGWPSELEMGFILVMFISVSIGFIFLIIHIMYSINDSIK